MTLDEILATVLDEDEIERIDRLAQAYGISRAQMLDRIIRAGLAATLEDAPPATERRPKGRGS